MKKFIALISLLSLFVFPVFTQTPEETKAEVTELKAFHEVIFKLWHDAWPQKDIAALSSMVPDIEKHQAKIQKAELPGILRDKKPKWAEGIKSLNGVVDEYKAAVASNDTQKILDAAEKLHAQYESMVRILRPVLKEVNEFHKVLYPLYHYHMPKYDKEKIKASVLELKAKMDSLKEVALPERLRSKVKPFNAKRRELEKAVNFLVKVVNEIDDEKTIKDAINEMHSKYQALEKVFD